MENVLATLISGICSIVASLGAVYLKHHLESRERISKTGSERRATTKPSEPSDANGRSPREMEPEARALPTSYVRAIGIVVGSFVLGVAVHVLNIEHLFFVILVGGVALAIFHRREGYQSAFQLDNFALWCGYNSGWFLMYKGLLLGEFLGAAIAWWFGCAVVGGLIVSVWRRNSEAETPSDG